jgi:hypothetical protein
MWKTIKITDFVKKMPRYVCPVTYEVDEAGMIRKYNPIAKTVKHKHVSHTGRITIVLGWAYCAVIQATLSVEDIVKKYFPEN